MHSLFSSINIVFYSFDLQLDFSSVKHSIINRGVFWLTYATANYSFFKISSIAMGSKILFKPVFKRSMFHSYQYSIGVFQRKL